MATRSITDQYIPPQRSRRRRASSICPSSPDKLVPDAGHFLLGKWIRGALLAVSIVAMFALGLAMQGKLYTGAQDILDLLGVASDLGSGLLYFAGRAAGWGAQPVQTTVADYGTKFIVVARAC